MEKPKKSIIINILKSLFNMKTVIKISNTLAKMFHFTSMSKISSNL